VVDKSYRTTGDCAYVAGLYDDTQS